MMTPKEEMPTRRAGSEMIIRLIQGECVAVMQTFPDASIGYVVTDPPYG